VRRKMGKIKLKAGGKIRCVRISFDRGRTSNGALTQTRVFSISPQISKEQKIKPDRTENNKRTNKGRDDYLLQPGKKYRIFTQRIDKGRTSYCEAILVVERNGAVQIEDWQGNFPPQFSLI